MQAEADSGGRLKGQAFLTMAGEGEPRALSPLCTLRACVAIGAAHASVICCCFNLRIIATISIPKPFADTKTRIAACNYCVFIPQAHELTHVASSLSLACPVADQPTLQQRRGLATSRRQSKSQIPGINTLMVANRGEIACRVMRTCKK